MAENKILIVEDEAHISGIIHDLLRLMNYEALVASQGSEALAFLEEHPINFLMVDISLPDMTGVQLYQKIVSRYPDLSNRFLFMSGADPDEELTRLLRETPNKFVYKPFQLMELKAEIEEMLAS